MYQLQVECKRSTPSINTVRANRVCTDCSSSLSSLPPLLHIHIRYSLLLTIFCGILLELCCRYSANNSHTLCLFPQYFRFLFRICIRFRCGHIWHNLFAAVEILLTFYGAHWRICLINGSTRSAIGLGKFRIVNFPLTANNMQSSSSSSTCAYFVKFELPPCHQPLATDSLLQWLLKVSHTHN